MINIGDINISKLYIGDTEIEKAYLGDIVIFSGGTPPVPPGPDYKSMPLTFNIISGGTINWTAVNTALTRTIEYKLNNGVWTSITSNTGSSAPSINVVEGDEIQFRGNNVAYSNGSYYSTFSGSTAKFEVEGNIMSLVDSTDFTTTTTLQSANTFNDLFNKCTGLTSAENLILPATTLTERCYDGMFYNCSSLTTAPELPATTLTSHCYVLMFRNCASLTAAPELPATALSDYCYNNMFKDCTSLTTAPVLPAATLANRCYTSMFSNCTSLNYIKCLATDKSASNCTTNWVTNVASTGKFVKDPNMSDWTTGNNGIPTGWTVEDAS